MIDLSRRQFLTAGAAAAVGAKFAGVMSPSSVLARSTTERPIGLRSLFGVGATTVSQTVHAPSLAVTPGAGYTSPYQLSANSTLSQDFFVTADVILDAANDKVVPFTNSDGTVAAVVMAGGNVSILARDATQASGWSFTPVPSPGFGNLSGALDVSAITDSSGVLWVIVLLPEYFGATTFVGSPSLLGWGWTPNDTPYPAAALPLKGGLDPAGDAYFYSFNSNDGSINVYIPTLTGGGLTTIPGAGGTVADGLLLFNPFFDQGDPANNAGWSMTLDDNQVMSLRAQTGLETFNPLPNQTVAAQALLWMTWSTSTTTTDPRYVIQTSDGYVQYIDFQDTPDGLASFDALTADQASVWFNSGLFAMAILDETTLTVFAQFGSPQSLTFTPGVQLETGILGVYGLSSDPDEATLFIVGADTTLSVLTKDPTLQTWSRTQVQQAAADAQDLSNWRTQITLTDANGVQVANADVAITADRTVGAWLPTGNLLLTPTTPSTFTTNRLGQLTLAIPALDLEAATLTVQLLDANSQPTGAPLVVVPDSDVHAFLGGTAPLVQLPVLTGATLASAVSPDDGKPLSSTLAGLVGTDQTNASTAIASALGSCISAGQAPAAAPAIQSFKLDMTSTVATYAESADANDPNTQPVVIGTSVLVGSSSWWDSVKHDVHSVEHSIRNGITKVTQCTAQFVENEENSAKNWVLNLVVDVENFGQNIATFVVDDIKSAITAIHGVFHAIEVDIDRAITWLRLAFSGLLTNTEANTKTVIGWVNELPAQATALLANLPTLTDDFFVSKESEVNAELQSLATTLENLTYDQFKPGSLTGSYDTSGNPAAAAPALLGDLQLIDLLKYDPANWLLNKIESEFSESNQSSGSDDSMTTIINNLITGLYQVGTTAVEQIATDLWTGLSATITKPSDAAALAIGAFIDILETVVHTALEIADDIVQALLALIDAFLAELAGYLTTAIDDIPLIGGILRKLGVDDSTTVGHIFGLIGMFPVTLIQQLLTDGSRPLFPATSSLAAPLAGGVGATPDPWGDGLIITHGGLRFLQGVLDVLADAQAFGDGDNPGNMTPLKWAGWSDSVIGLMLLPAVWPGKKNPDGTTAIPFTTPPDLDSLAGKLAISKWSLAATAPIVSAAMQVCKGNGLAQSYTTVAPYLATVVFGGVLGLGLAVDVEKKSEPVDYVITAMEVTPRVLAPLVTQKINEAGEGVPIAVKLFCDLAMEGVSGLLIIGEHQ